MKYEKTLQYGFNLSSRENQRLWALARQEKKTSWKSDTGRERK